MDFDEKRFRENQFPASDYFPLCKAAGFNLFGLGRGQYMFADAVESYLAKQMKERDMQAGLFPKSDNPQPKSGESMLRFDASDFKPFGWLETSTAAVEYNAETFAARANAKFAEWDRGLNRLRFRYSKDERGFTVIIPDDFGTHEIVIARIQPTEKREETAESLLRELYENAIPTETPYKSVLEIPGPAIKFYERIKAVLERGK